MAQRTKGQFFKNGNLELFGAWYSLFSLKMSQMWLLMPLFAYSLGLIPGVVMSSLITWAAHRRPELPV